MMISKKYLMLALVLSASLSSANAMDEDRICLWTPKPAPTTPPTEDLGDLSVGSILPQKSAFDRLLEKSQSQPLNLGETSAFDRLLGKSQPQPLNPGETSAFDRLLGKSQSQPLNPGETSAFDRLLAKKDNS